MKVLFLGAYNKAEIVLAPIKVGRELFKHISAKGVNSVYLCYFDDGSKYTRIQKFFGFEKISDKVYRCGILPFILFTIKYRPDIIQIITPDAFYLPIYLLKCIRKFKIAYLSHSLNSYSLKNFLEINCYNKFRFKIIEKITLSYSDILQILTKSQARFITKYLKVKSEKIRIVDIGTNRSEIKKKYFETSDNIKIICVGSLKRKEKSFEFLMEALSKIDYRIFLSIYSYEIQEKGAIQIPANVELNLGRPLNELELRKEFCNNDLFIIPSRTDSFPLSLLEAIETGILFISTDRVGLTERFPKLFTRFVVPYGNTDKLKDKILELHQLDCVEKNKFTEAIREFTVEYTWEKISDKYIKMYREILVIN
jgi:glycosyltransferase involved in cell wall biosynthesis